MKRAVEQQIIRGDQRVVLVLTGHGLKDVASARKAVGDVPWSRHKEAIARVRIAPGTGQWTVNGKPLPKE